MKTFDLSNARAVTRFQLSTGDAACIRRNPGSLLRVERGTVWVTEHGNYDDVCLLAGQTHRIAGNGMAVATAIARDDAVVMTLVRETRAPRVRQALDRIATLLRPDPVGTVQ